MERFTLKELEQLAEVWGRLPPWIRQARLVQGSGTDPEVAGIGNAAIEAVERIAAGEPAAVAAAELLVLLEGAILDGLLPIDTI